MTAAQHRFEDLGPPLLPPTATGHFRAAFRLPLTATPCECRPRAALWVRAHVGTGGIAGCDACEYPCAEGRCRSAFNATHVYSPAVLRAAGSTVLANAFLGNVVDLMVGQKSASQQGGLSFHRLLRQASGVHVNKTAALLLYFDARRTATDGDRMVRFEYVRCAADDEFERLVCGSSLRLVDQLDASDGRRAAAIPSCTIHTGPMEVRTCT